MNLKEQDHPRFQEADTEAFWQPFLRLLHPDAKSTAARTIREDADGEKGLMRCRRHNFSGEVLHKEHKGPKICKRDRHPEESSFLVQYNPCVVAVSDDKRLTPAGALWSGR